MRWYPRSPVPGARIPIGQDSGLQVLAGSVREERSDMDLEWKASRIPFLPRLDRVDFLESEGLLSLQGNFGLQRDKEVQLRIAGSDNTDEVLRMDIETWTANKILVKHPEISRPATYKLSIFNPEVDSDGNSVMLTFQ